jgi:hypothetical protein
VATAIAVIGDIPSVGMLIGLCLTKTLGQLGSEIGRDGYGRVSFFVMVQHPLEGAFVLSFL